MRYRWSKREGKMVPAAPRPRRPAVPMLTRQDKRNLKHLKAIQGEPGPVPSGLVTLDTFVTCFTINTHARAREATFVFLGIKGNQSNPRPTDTSPGRQTMMSKPEVMFTHGSICQDATGVPTRPGSSLRVPCGINGPLLAGIRPMRELLQRSALPYGVGPKSRAGRHPWDAGKAILEDKGAAASGAAVPQPAIAAGTPPANSCSPARVDQTHVLVGVAK